MRRFTFPASRPFTDCGMQNGMCSGAGFLPGRSCPVKTCWIMRRMIAKAASLVNIRIPSIRVTAATAGGGKHCMASSVIPITRSCGMCWTNTVHRASCRMPGTLTSMMSVLTLNTLMVAIVSIQARQAMPCWQKQNGAERTGATVIRHVPTDVAW